VLVSVLIPNHNYGRYLGTAIDSALGQSHPDIEVVVVDDGSTDDSRDVIRSYGERVVAVLQPKRGQVPALNAAFEASHGDFICLLDADDVFLSSKVERVLGAWRRRPQACLVHHRMQIIDAVGRPLHKPFPRRVMEGDLRERVARSGGWFLHAPSGALSFPRSFAQRLFPVPTDAGAGSGGPEVDTYLASPAAMVAPVAAVPEALTLYRIHGANRGAIAARADDRSAERLERLRAEAAALTDALRESFGVSVPLRLEDHLEYQLQRCAAGEISRAAGVRSVLRSPGLPAALKPREVLRVLANRGLAARV
jgi:glycosyltransferase involved in cell wall biosynthesis